MAGALHGGSAPRAGSSAFAAAVGRDIAAGEANHATKSNYRLGKRPLELLRNLIQHPRARQLKAFYATGHC